MEGCEPELDHVRPNDLQISRGRLIRGQRDPERTAIIAGTQTNGFL